MNADYSSELWQRMRERANQRPQSNLKQLDNKMARQRFLSENALVFLLQYIGLTLNTLSLQPYPVWFASGTACAFLFLRGKTVLPGIWFGSFSAYLVANAGLITSTGCATVFSLQALALQWLNYRSENLSLLFYRISAFIKFILGCALITLLTTVALVTLCHSHLLSKLAIAWWLANFNGALIIACSLMTWDAYFTQIHDLRNQHRGLLLTTFGLLLIAGIAVLSNHFVIVALPAIVILTSLIAYNLGWCGTIAAIFMLTCMMTFSLLFFVPAIMQFAPLRVILFFTSLTIFNLGFGVSLCQPQKSP